MSQSSIEGYAPPGGPQQLDHLPNTGADIGPIFGLGAILLLAGVAGRAYVKARWGR